MLLLTVWLMQSGVLTVDIGPTKSFDLRAIRPQAPCAVEDPEDIIVCGNRNRNRYRLSTPLATSRITRPKSA